MGRHRSHLAQAAGFDLLGSALAEDVRSSIADGLASGAAFHSGTRPLAVFRASLDEAIRDIQTHRRGKLIQRLLRDGPYEDSGEIPSELAGKRLTDDETAAAVAFVHSHLVSCFQGALAELLSVGPCVRLVRALVESGRLPAAARLLVGDSVLAPRAAGGQFAKAADLHVLAHDLDAAAVTVLGVAEVKSYSRTTRAASTQLTQHLDRARHGLRVQGRAYPPERVRFGPGNNGRVIQVQVRTSRWKLPRGFSFDDASGKYLLVGETPALQDQDNVIEPQGHDRWRITLRWSHEALAAAAYDISFWYMEEVGAVLFAEPDARPWPEMTPEEAGRNAAKQALYYAILRARNAAEAESAVALYNTYGFGYALGMNFRNGRRREMLWPEQLREIAAKGRCADGCRIARSRLEVPALHSPN
ncbi:MAG: hypothetical protein IT431_00965 [Phycisphaerales bacterium]|nr:hypothetical protein [Phycisphaerales bacterium]